MIEKIGRALEALESFDEALMDAEVFEDDTLIDDIKARFGKGGGTSIDAIIIVLQEHLEKRLAAMEKLNTSWKD
jgi:hypothetical protein